MIRVFLSLGIHLFVLDMIFGFSLKLEKDIKMTLAQKGAGGTVSSELKEKIRVVSGVHIWKCLWALGRNKHLCVNMSKA